ncbi:MAG TPA: MauE/DoxX family redox-associated membrane protein [Puia sp.]
MKRQLDEIASSLFVLLFTYAALSKLLDYNIFKIQLGKSPFVTQFSGTLAWAIPLLELFVSTTLLFKQTRLLGQYLSLSLMTMFSAYIFVMLHYSYYIPCSCGGILSKMTWNQHLVFNIIFVLLSIIAIYNRIEMKNITLNKEASDIDYSVKSKSVLS